MKLQGLSHFIRQIDKVFLVPGRHDDLLDSRTLGRQRLLLQSADG